MRFDYAMKKRYLLFWFDVEECALPQSDDAAKRLAQILTKYGVKATMKVVGQKARLLRERLRYDVIDALGEHAIGYHSDMHGFRPQPAEYMAKCDWEEGLAEFDRREKRGLKDLHTCWDKEVVCYGQPGSNWSPQVFPVLRKWGIPTYVSGYGYVGMYAQPFWFGGRINSSHLYGKDRSDQRVNHHIGLNFELGTEEAPARHKKQFDASYEALGQGGVISIMNHPCTLIKKRWFDTEQKTKAQCEAGYDQFERFVKTVLSYPDVEPISADRLCSLYRDDANQRIFNREQLMWFAQEAAHSINFLEFDQMSLSPAELFGMFVRFIHAFVKNECLAEGEICRHHDGPAKHEVCDSDVVIQASAFAESIVDVHEYMELFHRLPGAIRVGNRCISPDEYYMGMARTIVHLMQKKALPDKIHFTKCENHVLDFVDEESVYKGWSSIMMRPGFTAPKLLEQTYLQTWTCKPAILRI